MWTQVNYNRRGIEDMNYGVSLTYMQRMDRESIHSEIDWNRNKFTSSRRL